MAMLPFCGYHMGDYFAHWLKMGEKGGAKMPKIFYVNWFRKNGDGKFMWPGYAENSRVLKWIFERCDGTAKAVETPIGKLPAEGSLDVKGLKVAPDEIKELTSVDKQGWKAEIPMIKEHYAIFGDCRGMANSTLEAAGVGPSCRPAMTKVSCIRRFLPPCASPWQTHGSGKSVVAAGHELTANAAAEILQDGGNAFDAALAGMFMTFVAEAVFSSPGGGGFLMARRAGSHKAALFDFFCETPRRRRAANEVEFFPIHADFGPAKQEFHIGLGSSATPGVVPGLFAMHEALCRLPMKRLVEPAVRAARAGFPLTEFQAYLITVIAPILTASESVAQIFAPEERLLQSARHSATPILPRPSNGSPRMARGFSSTAMLAKPSSSSRATAAAFLPMTILPPIAWRGGRRSSGITPARPWRSTRRRRQAAH
jgi:hypothetical protein